MCFSSFHVVVVVHVATCSANCSTNFGLLVALASEFPVALVARENVCETSAVYGQSYYTHMRHVAELELGRGR